jgi:hypothetical protein
VARFFTTGVGEVSLLLYQIRSRGDEWMSYRYLARKAR